jgi:hypothetical protein
MAYEMRDNTGTLFNNDRKERDTQPDKLGRCLIDGFEYRVAVWKRVSKGGREYEAVAFTRVEDRVPTTKYETPADEDSLPFN